MSITIIQADVSHAATIASIGKKSFRNAFGDLFSSKEELLEYLEFSYNPVKLSRSIRKENSVYLIASLKGEPIGFAKIKKHSLNDHIASGAQMELQKLYILPEHQGAGAGSALLNETKRLAGTTRPDYVWLDTHITNERAIRLYERNGFKKIGKKYFTIGTQTFEYHVMGLLITESDNSCLATDKNHDQVNS